MLKVSFYINLKRCTYRKRKKSDSSRTIRSYNSRVIICTCDVYSESPNIRGLLKQSLKHKQNLGLCIREYLGLLYPQPLNHTII